MFVRQINNTPGLLQHTDFTTTGLVATETLGFKFLQPYVSKTINTISAELIMSSRMDSISEYIQRLARQISNHV